MDREIASRVSSWLAADQSGESPRVGEEDVRAWLRGYVSAYSEELVRFPRLAGRAHWDLAAWDSGPHARFVAASFQGDEVALLAGHGPAAEIRAFGDSGFPDDPREILSALSSRFAVGSMLTLRRDDVSRWIADA